MIFYNLRKTSISIHGRVFIIVKALMETSKNKSYEKQVEVGEGNNWPWGVH